MSDPAAPPNPVTNNPSDHPPPSTIPVVSEQPNGGIAHANTDNPPIPIVEQPAAVGNDASTATAGAYSSQNSSIIPMRIAPRTSGGASGQSQNKWDEMYQNLLAFKEQHGHCLVPNRYKENPQLGSWVSTQRRQYKSFQMGKSTPLTQARADLLESIGFVWATRDPRHVPWEQRYQELVDYKAKHGDCLVPIGFSDNTQLSNWVSTQRQEYKLLRDNRPTRLTEERIRLLNSIGFVWEAQRGGWRGSRKKRKTDQQASVETNALAHVAPTAAHALAPVASNAPRATTGDAVTSSSHRPSMVARIVTEHETSQSFRWHNDAPATRAVTAEESQEQAGLLPAIQEQATFATFQPQTSAPVVSASRFSPKPSTKGPAGPKDDDIFADADEEEDWSSPWSKAGAVPAPAAPSATGKTKADGGQANKKINSNNSQAVASKDAQSTTCEKNEAAAALLSVGVGKLSS